MPAEAAYSQAEFEAWAKANPEQAQAWMEKHGHAASAKPAQPQGGADLPAGWAPEKVPGGAPVDTSRPIVHNKDGSFSTERTITVESDGKHFVIPTIVNGRELPAKAAITAWRTGKNNAVGVFDDPSAAEDYAQKRTKYIGQLRGADAGMPQPQPQPTATAQQPANAGGNSHEIAIANPWGSPQDPIRFDPGAVARGAAQMFTLGTADEITGGAGALVDKIKGDRRLIGDIYRSERDSSRKAYKDAESRAPGSYLGGEIAGGVASLAIPGLGEGGATRAIATSAGLGGLADLGSTEKELSTFDKGNWVEAAKDAGKSALTTGAISAAPALLAATRRIPGAITDRLDKSKVVKSLTEYVGGLIKRNGDPEALRQAAGKLINESLKAAGNEPVAADKFIALGDELAKSSQNPYTRKLDPVAEEIVGAAEMLAKKGSTNLEELNNGITHWGNRAKDLKKAKDLQGARMALKAEAALKTQLAEATGNPVLADAASMLRKGRADYAAAKGSQALEDIATRSMDSLSADAGQLSPSAFAKANSAKKLDEIEQNFAGDKKAFARWKMAANASRFLAQRGNSWLPPVFPPAAQAAMKNFMTTGRAMKVFTDPEAHAAFMRLMKPGRSVGPEKAAAMLGQLFSRVKQLESDTGPQFTVNPASLSSARFEQQ